MFGSEREGIAMAKSRKVYKGCTRTLSDDEITKLRQRAEAGNQRQCWTEGSASVVVDNFGLEPVQDLCKPAAVQIDLDDLTILY